MGKLFLEGQQKIYCTDREKHNGSVPKFLKMWMIVCI